LRLPHSKLSRTGKIVQETVQPGKAYFIDQATLNGTRPNSPGGVKPA